MGSSAGRRRRSYGRRRDRGRGLRLEGYVGSDVDARASTQLDYTWSALRRLTDEVSVLDVGGRAREPIAVPEGPLEARLLEHLLSFYMPMELARGSGPLLWDRVFAGGDIEAEFAALRQTLPSELSAALLLFRPFWRRSPAGWSGSPRALLEHLFAEYPAPEFLLNVVSERPRSIVSRWLPWLITAGQGGSLRRLSRLARARPCPGSWPQLPKRFTAQLSAVPPGLQPRVGVMYAELLRMGGSALEFRRLSSDESYIIDPLVARPEARSFWMDAARWLIRYRDQLDDGQAAQILAWARHEHSEAQRRSGACFRWAGRTPLASLRAAQDYAGELERRREEAARVVSRWRRRGWDWGAQIDGVTWSIRELTSSEELAREGRIMKHCVAGYDFLCLRGAAAIFSVKRDGLPCLTLELRMPAGRIVQALGLRNRCASEGERRVLELWQAERVG